MTAQRPFIDPPARIAKEDCEFYHWLDLPSETVSGQWDLRGRIGDYLGNTSVKGRSIIDVGTASGFLTFEMEKHGAEVVSFDAASAKDIAFIPLYGHPYVTNHSEWCLTTDAYLSRLKNSYWYAHRALQSNSKVIYGNVYDIDTYGYTFDIAVIGQILIHLRDPVTALAAVSRLCRDVLIIAEGTHESSDTVGKMYARHTAGGPPYIWWQLSIPLYKELLAMFGFEIEQVTKNSYPCVHEYVTGSVSVTTIVARRTKTAPHLR
jgi:hypothetical protein